MSKILINNTAPAVPIPDTGDTVPAGIGSQLVINPNNYDLYAASSNTVSLVGDATLKVNDGSNDLTISDGIDLIKDINPRQIDTDTNGLVSVVDDSGVKRLAVDVKTTGASPNDFLVKVTSNDTTGDYLLNKVVASDESNTTNALEIKEVNDGGDEDLKIAFDESKITITESQISDLGHATDTFASIEVDGVSQSTNAPTLDFDGTDFLLTESPTDDFDITVKDSGIDHDQTTNYVANEHIDWTQPGAGTIDASNYVDNDTVYTHPNHTGEVTSTGDGAQVVDKTAISNKTLVTAATGDHILIGDLSDTDNLKKVTAQSIADLAAGTTDHGALSGLLDDDHTQYNKNIDVQDEGVSLSTRPVKMNFAGAGVTVTEPVTDEMLVTIPGGGGAVGDQPAVMARRTTRYYFTTAWVPLTFDTTDVENDALVVEHNNTTTSRVDIKEDGLYSLEFNTSFEQDGPAGNYYIRIRKNGTTTLGDVERAYNRGATAGSIRVDFTAMNDILAELVDGDYVEVEVKKDNGDPNDNVEQGATFNVVKLQGPKGDAGADGADGADGAPGSGTTLIIKEEGTNLANTPHSALNFIGASVTAADAGSGVASITISGGTFGSEYQKAESLGESTTTSTSYQQKVELTTSSLPSGDYVVFWSASVGNTTSDREFHARCRHNDTTLLGELGVKAKEGTGPSNNLEVTFSGHAILTMSGVDTIDIDYAAGSGTATIRHARITLWRVS